MRTEQHPLILREAGDRFTMPGDNPLAGMNPAFLAPRGIVALGADGGRLLVGMTDSDDTAAIAALKFATGREIDAVQLDLDMPRVPPFALAPPPVDDPRHPPQKASLADRLLAWLRAEPDDSPTLVSLAALLQAESDAALAGAAASGNGMPGKNTAAELARLLEQGVPLAPALAQSHGHEHWLALALATAPEPAHHALFARLVTADARLDETRDREARLQGEGGLLAIPAVLAWLALSTFAGALALTAAIAGLAALRKASAPRCDSDSLRARVLGLAASLIEAGCDRAIAVRAAMRRLQEFVPTWGALPDDAPGLAKALRLDQNQQALLSASDMGSGLRLLAEQCKERAERSLERRGWLVRLLTVTAFGAALALLQL